MQMKDNIAARELNNPLDNKIRKIKGQERRIPLSA